MGADGGKNTTVFFNYETKFTKVWDTDAWKTKYGYKVVFPDKPNNGTLTVSL